MRPVLLKMEAFGSYAEPTELHFDELQSSLFLITGNTGAGKTTIFDAIMFALYGEFSGSVREPKDMHSDFVPLSKDMSVELTFTHNDHTYEVHRWLHFRRLRNTENYAKDGTIRAELKGPDGRAVEGAGKVTAACTKIIGLTADQFKRIAMLAQGEFRRFLTADSKEKAEILSTLFDVSKYRKYQQVFHDACAVMKEKREELEQRLVSLQDLLDEDDFTELSEEEKAGLHTDSSDFEKVMQDVLARHEEKIAALKEEKEKNRKKSDALLQKIALADRANQTLDRLAQYQQEEKDLAKRADAMAQLQKEAAAAETALHIIQPLRTQYAEAVRNEKTHADAIAAAQKQRDDDLAVQKQAEEAMQADPAMQEELKNRQIRERNLTAHMPDYRRLSSLQQQLQTADETLAEAEKTQTRLQKERTAKEAQVQAVHSTLERLQDAEKRYADAANTRKEKQRQSAEASDLQQKTAKASAEEKAYLHQKEEGQKIYAETMERSAAYQQLYTRFLDGQAGLLGLELKKAVERDGQGICPVCHSVITKEKEESIAPKDEHTPARAEVDAARKAFDTADQAYKKAMEKLSAAQTAFQHDEDEVLRLMRRFDPACQDFADVVSRSLPAYLEQCRQEEASARQAEETAAEDLQKYHSLKEKEEKLRRSLDDLHGKEDRVRDSISELKSSKSSLSASRDELQKQLAYADQTAAGKALAEEQKEIQHLQKVLKEHQEQLTQAEAALHKTDGRLGQLQKEQPGLMKVSQDKKEQLSSALREHGFPSEEAAAVWIEKGESWLKEAQKKEREYEKDCERVKASIAAAEKEVKEKKPVRTDVQALLVEKEALQKQNEETEQMLSQLETSQSRNRNVLGRASLIRKKLADGRESFARIERLADLGDGTAGEGGILSFERYVLGWVFREVLAKANVRLNMMSDGRYEMVHHMEADKKNRLAGFDIYLMDYHTGQERPVSTISGGESFEVSLALALGLSDVVQAEAGARRLETLFIDEGFGTLDDDKLDHAVRTLEDLAGGDRLVGVISHVERLQDAIPQKIVVTSDPQKGSSLKLEWK